MKIWETVFKYGRIKGSISKNSFYLKGIWFTKQREERVALHLKLETNIWLGNNWNLEEHTIRRKIGWTNRKAKEKDIDGLVAILHGHRNADMSTSDWQITYYVYLARMSGMAIVHDRRYIDCFGILHNRFDIYHVWKVFDISYWIFMGQGLIPKAPFFLLTNGRMSSHLMRLKHCFECRSRGCCTLHNKIWRGFQLPGFYKLQRRLHSCRDDAREWPLGLVLGQAHQQLPRALHSEGRCPYWGQVHLQPSIRILSCHQTIPLQACICSSVLHVTCNSMYGYTMYTRKVYFANETKKKSV